MARGGSILRLQKAMNLFPSCSKGELGFEAKMGMSKRKRKKIPTGGSECGY